MTKKSDSYNTSGSGGDDPDDEAALIDSLFMPGGILNPLEEDSTNKDAEQSKLQLQPASSSVVPPLQQHQQPDASAMMKWPSSSAAATFSPSHSAAIEDGFETNLLEGRDSFWAGAGAGIGAGQSLWPMSATAAPDDMAESLFGSSNIINSNHQENNSNNNNTNNMDGIAAPAASLFTFDSTFGASLPNADNIGSNNQTNSLIGHHQAASLDDVQVIETSSPMLETADESLRHVQSLQLASLLEDDHHLIVPPQPQLLQQPEPSKKEQDVRQMIQALSSTLIQSPGGYPIATTATAADHTSEQQHVMQPDSPPKIIRQRSSTVSQSHSNYNTNAHPVEELAAGVTAVDGSDDNGGEEEDYNTTGRNNNNEAMDFISATSSLSSGSAHNGTHESELEPPMPVSVVTTSGFPGRSQSQQQQSPPPPPATFALKAAAAAVLPPPGYTNMKEQSQSAAVAMARQGGQKGGIKSKRSTKSQKGAAAGVDKKKSANRTQSAPSNNNNPGGKLSYSSISRTKPTKNSNTANLSPRMQQQQHQQQQQSPGTQQKQSKSPPPPPPQVYQQQAPEQNQQPRKSEKKVPRTSSAPVPNDKSRIAKTSPTSPKQRKASRNQEQQQEKEQLKQSQQGASSLTKPGKMYQSTTSSNSINDNGKQHPRQQILRDTNSDSSNSSHKKTTSNYTGDILRALASSKETTSSSTSTTTNTKTVSKQQRAVKAVAWGWSDWASAIVDFAVHLVEFGMQLLSCMIQEGVKEAVERQKITFIFILLYMTPIISYVAMDYSGRMPHYFPGITMGLALWWICRQILNETDPSFLLEAYPSIVYQSSSSQQQDDDGANSSSLLTSSNNNNNNNNKKKSRSQGGNNNTNSVTSAEVLRTQELRAMEANICHVAVLNLRWSLPLLVFVQSVVSTPILASDTEENLASMRLVAAFGLAMLKTNNILSPLAWISGSIQVLFVLATRQNQSFMGRWCGLEMMVATFGLSTLRFLRLQCSPRSTTSATSANNRRKQ